MCKVLPIEFVQDLYSRGMITEVIKGGLVLGDRHSEEGIKIMQITGDTVYCVGEMEGGEYIINCFATEEHLDRIIQINDDNSGEVEDIPQDIVRGIRHYHIPSGHWVIKSALNQAIINRSATKKYLEELNEINESTMGMFEDF